MGEPIDDACGPRPLRRGLSLADANRVLERDYAPMVASRLMAIRHAAATDPALAWWREEQRMRRAWPRMVLFPHLEALDDRRVRLRDRLQSAWWAAREDWAEHG